MFHIIFVQIAEFGGGHGGKRVNFRNNVIINNLFFGNHKVDEADSLHTCL